MTNRLYLVPVVGAVLATLVTWLPMLAYPGWVLPPYDLTKGIDLWAQQALWFTIFTCVALLIGEGDTFLGLAIFYLGATYLLWGGTFTSPHALIFMGGALVLHVARHVPTAKVQLVTRIMAASGAFQAVYVIGQSFHFDLFWGPLFGGVLLPDLRALGTLGTEDAAGGYVAITAPLLPWWLLPLPLMAVVIGQPQGHSITAITALFVGLLVRYHRSWKLTGGLLAGLLGLATYVFATVQVWHIPSTASARIAVWWLAAKDWYFTVPLAGYLPNIDKKLFYSIANPLTGNGSWWPRVPILQHAMNVLPTNESFAQAHNEYLQWGYERGLVGVALLAGWLWVHRRMFRAEHGIGAALCAAVVAAGGFFTFQVVGTALLMLVLIGCATRFDSQEVA